jgi:hypothetical protein
LSALLPLLVTSQYISLQQTHRVVVFPDAAQSSFILGRLFAGGYASGGAKHPYFRRDNQEPIT